MGAENVLIELIYISSKVYLVFYLKKNGDAVGSGVKNNALEAIFMNKG